MTIAKILSRTGGRLMWLMAVLTMCIPLCAHSDNRQVGLVGVREGLLNANIRDIEQDGDGLLWVGTEEGLFHLTGDRSRHYDERMMGLEGCNISSLAFHEPSNTLWVATLQSGVTRYDCSRREFHPLVQADGLLSDMVTCVCAAADGGMWIFHHRGMIQHWHEGKLTTLLTSGLPDVIRSGLDDGKGHLYVGHRERGVSRISLSTGEIMTDVPVRYLSPSATGRDVFHLRLAADGVVEGGTLASLSLTDSEGNVWSRLEGRGLRVSYNSLPFFRMSPLRPVAEPYIPVSALIQDADGGLWMGGMKGLQYCRPDGTIIDTVDIFSPAGIRDKGWVKALHLDDRGHLLIGLLFHSIIDYDIATGQVTPLRLASRGIDVHHFVCDSAGTLWAATEMGLYARAPGGSFERDSLRSGHLHSQLVHCIGFDADGNMWIGTVGDGLTVLDARGGLLARVRAQEGLLSENISCMYIDGRTVWIGTQGGLIHVPDSRRPHEFQILDQQQGLASDRIEAIVKDRFGQLWISTQIGVSAWDTVHHRFINYSYEDGLPEGMYFEGAGLALHDGRLCFGSYNGLAVITPEPEGSSHRVGVSLFPFRFPAPWYLRWPMLLMYGALLVGLAVFFIRRIYVNKSHEVVQTERVLQAVAPVSIEMSSSDRQFINRLTTYVEENLQSESLDVASIAQEMAMSHSAFYRKVKSLTGCTAAEFIRKVKLRKSRQLLEQGGHTVSEVAQLTGFNNLGNFRQAFKKEFGMPPSASNKAKEGES